MPLPNYLATLFASSRACNGSPELILIGFSPCMIASQVDYQEETNARKGRS